jgi:hypothetical protein
MSDEQAAPEVGATSPAADAAGGTADMSIEDRLKAMEERNAFLEAEAKKAFADRDKLKAWKREQTTAAQQAAQESERRAAEAGEYKTAYEKAHARLEEVLPQVERFEQWQESRRTQVESEVAELPEELRELFDSSAPLEKQEEQLGKLRKFATTQAGPPTPPAHSPAVPREGSILDIADPVERAKAWRSDDSARRDFLRNLPATAFGALRKK